MEIITEKHEMSQCTPIPVALRISREDRKIVIPRNNKDDIPQQYGCLTRL